MDEKDAPGETTLFIQKMDGELLGWDQPAARLREALDKDHFRLYAQPVMRLDAGAGAPDEILMAEVLVRLREQEARMLPPGDFLPAFEHYGMMAELDRWVVRHALQRLGGGGGVKKLSVNVSSQTLEEPGFAPFVAAQLRLASLAPGSLVIEIHENDALERGEAAARFAAEMKAVGCQLLLDGFARRSVSFDPLKALQVDYVKVDGTVTRKIMRSASTATKLKAVLRVGEGSGIGVIAECVEDDRILSALKLLKVPYAQGFGLRAPAPIEELLKS
jgi:EAL domain-containing protein (putative c-di-GMP-specific phosphodiesterase class I)